MNLKIYNIPAVLRQAFESIEVDPETGEILNADALESVEMAATEKIAHVARYIREMESNLAGMKEAKAAMDRRIKSQQRQIDWFKANAKAGMIALQAESIEDGDIVVKFHKSSSLIIDDDSIIPSDFVTIITDKKIDKREITKAIKAGTDVPGVHIEVRQNLVIE